MEHETITPSLEDKTIKQLPSSLMTFYQQSGFSWLMKSISNNINGWEKNNPPKITSKQPKLYLETPDHHSAALDEVKMPTKDPGQVATLQGGSTGRFFVGMGHIQIPSRTCIYVQTYLST